MIPKRIFTCWFGGEPDEVTKRCIESQKIPGYEHRLITLDNVYRGSRYANEAIAAEAKLGVKRWCKVADFMRLYYLYTEGGIYLDSDFEVLPGKNFDDLLNNQMFVGLDEDGNYASSAMGSVPGHPLLAYIMNQTEDNFRGDGGWVWETGFLYFTDTMKKHGAGSGVKPIPSDYFFPYHWRQKTIDITENTRAYHHYLGSWVK